MKSILQGCLYLKAAQKLTQDNLTHIFSKPAAAHGLAQTLCGRDCFAGAKDKTLSKLIAAEKQEWLRQSKMNKLEDHINAPESDSERNSGEQIPARRKLSFFKLMEEAMLAAPVLNQEEGASVSMSPQ